MLHMTLTYSLATVYFRARSGKHDMHAQADMAMDAVDMYSRAGKWDAAQKVARGYLTDAEMRGFYR